MFIDGGKGFNWYDDEGDDDDDDMNILYIVDEDDECRVVVINWVNQLNQFYSICLNLYVCSARKD